MTNYWHECVSEALEDAGIDAAEDQINTVTDWVEGAHENYGMYSGNDIATGNWHSDYNEKIKKANSERDEIESKTSHAYEERINGIVDRYERLVYELRREIERLSNER